MDNALYSASKNQRSLFLLDGDGFYRFFLFQFFNFHISPGEFFQFLCLAQSYCGITGENVLFFVLWEIKEVFVLRTVSDWFFSEEKLRFSSSKNQSDTVLSTKTFLISLRTKKTHFSPLIPQNDCALQKN